MSATSPAPTSYRERLDHQVSQALNRRLVTGLAARDGRRGIPVARVVATLLAVPVYLLCAGLLLGGAWLLLAADGWFHRVVAVFAMLLAFATRPSWRTELDDDEVDVPLAEVPAVASLLSRVAGVVGTAAPQQLRLLGEANAYAARHGLSARVLGYGAPLWLIEGRAERLATLGHEMGHFAHGDTLRGRFVAGAYLTLQHWVALFTPEPDAYGDIAWSASVMTWPGRVLLRGYRRLFELVNAGARRRQELYADLASAQVAGTRAAVTSLELLLVAPGVADVTLNRAAMDASRPDLARALGERARLIDGAQRAAARVAAGAERSRSDEFHPPTLERLRLVEGVTAQEAAVHVSDSEWDRIEAELAPHLDRVLRRVCERYRYVS